MKGAVLSKDAILIKIREIVARDGLDALSIRGLAKELDCSVGIIYYFESKDELIVEAIESVWEDIFQADETSNYDSFLAYISDSFTHISSGIKKYPNFFTLHTIMLQADKRTEAKSTMQIYMTKLKSNMKEVLDRDSNVKKGVFTDDFTEDDFINFVMSNTMSFILDPSYKKEFFVKIIDKILY